MKKIHQSHDKFFKSTFSLPEVTQEYLETFLPPDILSKTDLSTLVLDSNSYIDERLSAYYSDLVWNVAYRKTTIKVALLFEHKTTPSKYIHNQLLRYMQQIWDKNIENSEDLVPIIPIVIYQGRRKWKKRSFDSLFKGIDSSFARYLPIFDYERTDSTLETERLLQNGLHFRALKVFRALRQVIYNLLDRDNLLNFSKELHLFEPVSGGVDGDINMRIFTYVYTNTNVPAEVVWDDYQVLKSQLKSDEMSTFDQLIAMGTAKGKVEGKAEGKAEGTAEGTLLATHIIKKYTKGKTPAQIADALDTPLAVVQRIIADFELE